MNLVTRSLKGQRQRRSPARAPAQRRHRDPAPGALCVGGAALRRGEVVVNLVDQNMLPKRGVFVRFFGAWACTTPAASLLAMRTGAPVMVAVAVNLPDGRTRLCVEGPFAVPSQGASPSASGPTPSSSWPWSSATCGPSQPSGSGCTGAGRPPAQAAGGDHAVGRQPEAVQGTLKAWFVADCIEGALFRCEGGLPRAQRPLPRCDRALLRAQRPLLDASKASLEPRDRALDAIERSFEPSDPFLDASAGLLDASDASLGIQRGVARCERGLPRAPGPPPRFEGRPPPYQGSDSRMLTVPSTRLATARSGSPSPLKSPATRATGASPTP